MKDDMAIAKCPGCKSDAIVAGVGLITEFGPMTYSQVQCGQSTTGCGYKGPYGHDPDHAIRLHNLLCRPAEDGLAREPMAAARKYEAGHDAAEQSTVSFLKAHLATLRHTEAVADCLHCSLNYLISRFIDKHRALHALLDLSPPLEPFAPETLEHVHILDKQALVTSDPADLPESIPDDDPRRHNCDAMGCPTLDHVLYRLPFTDHRKPVDTKALAKELAESIDFTAGPVQAREKFNEILPELLKSARGTKT